MSGHICIPETCGRAGCVEDYERLQAEELAEELADIIENVPELWPDDKTA